MTLQGLEYMLRCLSQEQWKKLKSLCNMTTILDGTDYRTFQALQKVLLDSFGLEVSFISQVHTSGNCNLGIDELVRR